ncbi:MAG TPA: ATP-binding protein [Tepidisphaeraceae bacterium]|nr:ATP-binding protein [Tepidisphaeraceae bacterium]
MEQDLRSRWRFILFVNLAALAWILFVPFGKGMVSLLANTVFPLCGALLCVVLGKRFRNVVPAAEEHAGMRQAAWMLMVAGSVTYAVGSMIYYYYDLVLDEPPFPSIADAIFFCSYPLIISGMTLLPTRKTSSVVRGRLLLDTLITTVAAATFSWYFLLGPILQQDSDSWLGRVLASGYTIFDVAGLFCILLLSGRLTGTAARFVVLPVVLGNVCNIAADTLWGYRILNGVYEVGEPLDVLWPTGFMLICLAARAHRLAPYCSLDRDDAEVPTHAVTNGASSAWRPLVPYALMPLLAGMIVYDYRTQSNAWLSYGVYGGSLLLLCLLLVRQLLSIIENARLNRELSKAFGQLDFSHQSLSRAHAKLEAIGRASMDGVLLFDETLSVTEVNPAAQRLFGHSGGSVVGTSMSSLFRLANRNAMTLHLVTDALIGHRIDAEARRADGTTFPAELAVVKMDLHGPSAFVAFVRNQTLQRATEAERENLHSRLMTASRQAGMAEMASGVLHNVGNVLNSINVSAAVVSETLRGSEVASLKRASELIDQHLSDFATYVTEDDRGRQLPAFLVEVAKAIANEQDVLLHELRSLGSGVEHIKQIISAQQAHAKSSVIAEPVSPRALVESAITMHSESLSNHDIRIIRKFDGADDNAVLDRHKVLQILVNLISNAKQAVKEAKRDGGTVMVSIGWSRATASGHAPRIRFTIADNGVGIPQDSLTKIFSHGFTTRSNGHGFGLHSAANLAREMGGTLRATSDGLGTGAAFELDVPSVTCPAATIDLATSEAT